MALKIKALPRDRKVSKKFPNNVCGQCVKYKKCKGVYYMEHSPCEAFKPLKRLLVSYYVKKKKRFTIKTPQPENGTFLEFRKAVLKQQASAKKKGFSELKSITPFMFKCSCGRKRMSLMKIEDNEIYFQCSVCGSLEIMEI